MSGGESIPPPSAAQAEAPSETPRRPDPEPLELGWRGRYTRGRSRRRETPVPPVPFIVGATRSGTTLLRLMLDAHPELALPSETHFIPDVLEACRGREATAESLVELFIAQRRWGDFRLDPEELLERLRGLERLAGPDVVRAFFRLYADRQEKPRWGDKTPGYVKKMRMIQEELPEARFIHLIRDGRDVALSVLKMSFGPNTVEAAAERWRERIERGRSHARFLGHYKEIHFEDLVLDAEGTLREVCEFIELDYDEAMLGYHERAAERLAEKARELSRRHGASQSAAARMKSHEKTLEPPKPEMVCGWKQRMEPEDVRRYELVAGELLSTLGYEVHDYDTGEVHEPGRGVSVPKPVKQAMKTVLVVLGRGGEKEERPPAPFIVGMTRGGYELLAEMLGAHPELTVARETGFVPGVAETIRSEPVTVERVVRLIAAARPVSHYGIAEGRLRERLSGLEELKAAPVMHAFYELVAAAGRTPRFGDATGAYLQRMRRIQRVVSEAHFIHVVRDGRDIVASRPGELETGKTMVMAQKWAKRVGGAHEDEGRLAHYLEIRYEDLVADPEATLREVCEFVALEYDPAMLVTPRRSEVEAGLGSIGRWRERLTVGDIAAFEEVGGELLAALGHELSDPVGERSRGA